MTLVTRCPVCVTAFRVQRQQLGARGGRVRCGKCGTVFDGVAGLLEEPAERSLASEPSPQLALFDGKQRESAAADAETEEPALPSFLESRPRARHTLLWGVLAVFAGSVLAVQVVYRYRTDVAFLVPGARPMLEAACAPLGCRIPLPRRPDLMGIESSDLQADPRRESVIVLNAVLRNRAPYAQEYPALELTLTDELDRALLRRVLTPADYLTAAQAPTLAAQGVAPGAEAQLRLYLDTGGVRATGYRLYLFYP